MSTANGGEEISFISFFRTYSILYLFNIKSGEFLSFVSSSLSHASVPQYCFSLSLWFICFLACRLFLYITLNVVFFFCLSFSFSSICSSLVTHFLMCPLCSHSPSCVRYLTFSLVCPFLCPLSLSPPNIKSNKFISFISYSLLRSSVPHSGFSLSPCETTKPLMP